MYAKRPICDSGYYQAFNQDNCDIVSLRETPIDAVVPNGIKCSDGKVYELDVLICATGYEVEGNYSRVRFRGRNGLTLADKWETFPASYLGIFGAQVGRLSPDTLLLTVSSVPQLLQCAWPVVRSSGARPCHD
jgi:cation diffusion facilitator CzcD-associated flavoprotein CzcO